MTKKILIFGGGFVGLNLAYTAKEKGWEPYIADCVQRSHPPEITWLISDITDEADTKNTVNKIKPDYIVNVAALADVDKAEQNRELAYKINVDGAKYLAEASKKVDAGYLYFSSDAVFSGRESIYHDNDQAAPVNYYGYTKSIAERDIIKINPQSMILRVSLILGYSIAGGNSFFEAFKNKLENSSIIACTDTEIRTPIDVYTLCECVIMLLEKNLSGVFNIGSKDHVSRLELSRKIASVLNFDENKVVGQEETGQAVTGRASRHRNGILAVSKIEEALNIKMPGIDEVIKRAADKKY